jgi:hypothetical protein
MRHRHHHRPDPILPLLVLAGTAVLAYSFLRGARPTRHVAVQGRRGAGSGASTGPSQGASKMAAINPKVAEEAEELDCATYVRPAGPESMRDRPRRGWDHVDEQVDESFPASDPPANY